MIHFVTGKPGGGKTLYSMHIMAKRLVHSNCVVVTNVAVELPRLNEYIQEKFPDADIDVVNRVVLLDREDVTHFYRFRSGGFILPEFDDSHPDHPTKKCDNKEFVTRASAYFRPLNDDADFRRPVFYIIDEAHIHFGARDWASTPRMLAYYATQHRHLGDEVILITQHLDQVEKQLRNLADEFHIIVNHYRRSFGLFSARPRFERQSFFKAPTAPTIKPYETASFKIDVEGVASCYNTRGALGIEATEEQARDVGKKRLPWWTVWAGLAAGACAIMFMLWMAPKAVAGYFDHATSTVSSGMLKTQKDVTDMQVRHIQGQGLDGMAVGTIEQQGRQRLPDPEKLVVKSWLIRGDKVTVILSDGRVLTEASKELQAVHARQGAKISGEWVPMAPVGPGRPVSSPVPAPTVIQPPGREAVSVPPPVPQSTFKASTGSLSEQIAASRSSFKQQVNK